MNAMGTQTAIRQFFAEAHLELADTIRADENLFEAKMIDSLGIINLVLFLEETFSVSLDYEDMTEDNFRTLDALVTLVQSAKGA